MVMGKHMAIWRWLCKECHTTTSQHHQAIGLDFVGLIIEWHLGKLFLKALKDCTSNSGLSVLHLLAGLMK